MICPPSSLYRYTPGPGGIFLSFASSVGFIWQTFEIFQYNNLDRIGSFAYPADVRFSESVKRHGRSIIVASMTAGFVFLAIFPVTLPDLNGLAAVDLQRY